ARLPITLSSPDLSDKTPHAVHHVFNFIGKGVIDEDFLLPMWQDTFANVIVPTMQEHQYPSSDLPNDWPTVEKVKAAERADILHITCHGGEEDEYALYWMLDQAKPEFSYRIRTSWVEKNL